MNHRPRQAVPIHEARLDDAREPRHSPTAACGFIGIFFRFAEILVAEAAGD